MLSRQGRVKVDHPFGRVSLDIADWVDTHRIITISNLATAEVFAVKERPASNDVSETKLPDNVSFVYPTVTGPLLLSRGVLWKLNSITGTAEQQHRFPSPQAKIDDLAASPDRNFVAVCDGTGGIVVHWIGAAAQR